MEKNQATTGTPLDDNQLASVAGGLDRITRYKKGDKYYKYVGGDKDSGDWNRLFVCMFCGAPLRYGRDYRWGGYRWYCDECQSSWLEEEGFDINKESGVWQEITMREYWDPSLG